ncbi:chitobiase/beta-hexosaminidase C-terminal domain-containing protein [bacterium]|nr:chitobiase/beta-hexosaminidase C-terminal domain-containing protein [bacterium]
MTHFTRFHAYMALFVVIVTFSVTVRAQQSANPDYFRGGEVDIISSSHQDIGWMDTPEKCIESRDLKVITPALERLKENPEFRFVMEDMLSLMEYLGRHPERKEEIRRLTAAGRFEWGATYNQPYESMYDGEALIRQTYLGRKWLKKNLPGCDSRTAWSPDVPGRAMQMPQILAKAGIRYLHMSRHEKGFYRWLSPDGTGVLAFSPGHYHWSGEIFRESMAQADHTTIVEKTRGFEAIAQSLSERLKADEKYYKEHGIGPRYGLIYSTDFSGPANLDELFKDWNGAVDRGNYGPDRKPFTMPKLQYATGESFLKAVSEGNPKFDTITGERPDVWLYIHGPTHHRAISAGRDAARLLTAAEEFSTIEALLSGGFGAYPADELTGAWSEAIYPDHGWGGYNGHITDRIFRDKMESGRDRARKVLDSALVSIAGRVAVKDVGIPVVVFNDLSWKRTDPVVCTVNVYGRENTMFRLVDALGRDISYQVIPGSDGGRPGDEELRIVFVAADVPSIGYKTYYLLMGESPRVTGSPVTDKNGVVENDYYRIEFAPGGIRQIFDRELNKPVLKTDKFLGAELFTMQSVGNGAGEFAEVQQPTMDGFEKLSDYKPSWMCTENGPVRSVYETARKINHCTVRERVIVYHTVKRIDCEFDLLGWDGTNSREFRLAFPLDMTGGKVAYEVPMGVVEVGKSEIAGAAGERYVQKCSEVRPREVQDWFGASDGKTGITISSSVAVFDWADPTEAAVSYPVLQPVLLASRRSCHGEGNWYLQAGDHSYRFSIYSHGGDWHNGYKLGKQSNRPLRVVSSPVTAARPSLPEEMSFCTVGPGDVIVSTVKKCEDDDTVIVRCYEVGGNDTQAAIEWFTPVVKAELTNIIEEEGVPVESTAGKIPVKMGHHAIETVKLNPQAWAYTPGDIMPPSPPVFTPSGGIYRESSLKVSLTAQPVGAEIRYTVDGTEPDERSTLYAAPLVLKGNTRIQARAFVPGRSASRASDADFRVGMSPAVKVSSVVNGLDYEYFEGSWSMMPDFSALKALKKGTAQHFGLEPADPGDNYGLRFSGYIDVPEDGIYTFYTTSDDGSRLLIDNQVLVDNDGLHWPITKEGAIALKKGRHMIVVLYFQGGGNKSFEVGYEGPGVKRQIIPDSVLFRKKTD